MNNVELIGMRIKTCREELNMTQEQLGNKIGLNKSTIQRYETGKIERVKLPVLSSMAKVFNVDPQWLICKTDLKSNFALKSSTNQEIQDEIEDEDIVTLNRKIKKLKPEQRAKLIEMAKIMFMEDFDD